MTTNNFKIGDKVYFITAVNHLEEGIIKIDFDDYVLVCGVCFSSIERLVKKIDLFKNKSFAQNALNERVSQEIDYYKLLMRGQTTIETLKNMVCFAYNINIETNKQFDKNYYKKIAFAEMIKELNIDINNRLFIDLD